MYPEWERLISAYNYWLFLISAKRSLTSLTTAHSHHNVVVNAGENATHPFNPFLFDSLQPFPDASSFPLYLQLSLVIIIPDRYIASISDIANTHPPSCPAHPARRTSRGSRGRGSSDMKLFLSLLPSRASPIPGWWPLCIWGPPLRLFFSIPTTSIYYWDIPHLLKFMPYSSSSRSISLLPNFLSFSPWRMFACMDSRVMIPFFRGLSSPSSSSRCSEERCGSDHLVDHMPAPLVLICIHAVETGLVYVRGGCGGGDGRKESERSVEKVMKTRDSRGGCVACRRE